MLTFVIVMSYIFSTLQKKTPKKKRQKGGGWTFFKKGGVGKKGGDELRRGGLTSISALCLFLLFLLTMCHGGLLY